MLQFVIPLDVLPQRLLVEFMSACDKYQLLIVAIFDKFYLMSKSISFPDGPSDGVTYRVPAWIKTMHQEQINGRTLP